MAPTCSRVAIRLLTSILLISSIVNAAALPHQVLDPRTPLIQLENLPEVQARAPVTPDVKKPKKAANLYDQIGDILRTYTGYDFLRDLVERLFGEHEDSNGEWTSTTSFSVSPTPVEVVSSVTTVAPETTYTPVSTNVFSILPVDSVTTAIDTILPDPVFISSASIPTAEASSYISEVIPPFSVNFTSVPTSEPSSSNETATNTSTTRFQLTSIILVTATVVPSPVPGTGDPSAGTGINTIASDIATPLWPNSTFYTPTPVISGTGGVSSGTGISTPVSDDATPLWPNSTFVGPTAIASGTGVSAGTGISNATVTQAPLYPNTTFVLPTIITVTGGPGTALNVSIPVTIPLYANTSFVLPTPSPGTGGPGTVTNVSITFSESPLYPNTTYITPTAILGTGTAAPSAGTISNTPISFTEIPLFPNSTYVSPTSFLGTGTAAPSVGTISNAPINDTVTPLFPNITIITSTITTTLEPTLLPSTTAPMISPNTLITSLRRPSTTLIPFSGLLALRSLCQDPQIRVITLPILNRFYGPSGYPSLFSFPGCLEPNSRQAVQAPGLLNCTALGAEVQRCQASGRKVLLSIKADNLGAVGGNAEFGDPGSPVEPFGPYFAEDSDDEMEGEEKRKKRQIVIPRLSLTIPIPRPPFSIPPRPISIPPISIPRLSITPSKPAVVVSTPTALPVFPPISPPSLAVPLSSSSPLVSSTTTLLSSSLAGLSTPIILPTVLSSSSILVPSSSVSLFSPSVVLDSSSTSQSPSSISLFTSIISIPDTPLPTPSFSETTQPEVTETTVGTEQPIETVQPVTTESPVPVIAPFPTNEQPPTPPFPNLFNENHPPSAFALTLFSLFGEGHTERADLRPLGPDVGTPSVPLSLNGSNWVNPATSILRTLSRPLGEEVIVDGYDVQLPVQWKGSYQDDKFRQLVARLRELNREAWRESGGIEGGPGDLGADGRGVVYFGWIGELLKAREAREDRAGWVEWDGQT
ncbi:hypothetical protein BKA66DRAFT_506583, partial [Pyrenochaeta sp. MPI-SDFR-AT-0127]